MIIELPFKFLKNYPNKHFLNEKSMNMLKILKIKTKKKAISCKEFLMNSVSYIGFSRSTFFRYLDSLNCYNLIVRYDFGVNENGYQVYYKISEKGDFLLNLYSDYFGIK